MSIKHVQFALDGVPGLNPSQRLTLVSIGEWANHDGVCWPSHDLIAQRVGVTRRQVIRIIDQLEALGLVAKTHRNQHSNTYQMVDKLSASHVTPTSYQDVTHMSDVTLKADVTSVTPDVTFPASDVTPMASRCDTHVTRTVKNHQLEPPIEPLESARAKKTTAKKASQLSDEFVVTDDMFEWAWLELHIHGDEAGRETEKFRDYHRAKGSTMKDWEAAWRNWMRNSVTFNQPRNATGRASPAKDDIVTRNLRNLGVMDEEPEYDNVIEPNWSVR